MLEKAKISNINGGAIPRKFAQELEVVLEDIRRTDKPADKTRSIIITVEITPTLSVTEAGVHVLSKTKLPAKNSKYGLMSLSEDLEGIRAAVDTSQMELEFGEAGVE